MDGATKGEGEIKNGKERERREGEDSRRERRRVKPGS